MFKHQNHFTIMKIAKQFFALSLIATLASCNEAAPDATVQAEDAKEVEAVETTETVSYTVDTSGDEISWVGYKTFNLGDAHNGVIQVSEGNLMAENGALVGGEFTIDMTTIANLDVENAEYKAKLENHLKSPDFFDVDSFGTATFVITNLADAAADDTTGATHMVTGNLTLRGISKSITIPATVAMMDDKIAFSTPEFVIDRSQWNVQFRSTSFAAFADIAKENVIDNNIKLQVSFKAVKA
jgi:polyisoprenoid-binding protein YceI